MCNFECDHCFLYCSPHSKGTFNLIQVKKVLEQLQKIGTLKTIGFEGGEPFLFHPKEKDRVLYFKEWLDKLAEENRR